MVETNDRQVQPPLTIPAWRWPVLLTGWGCLIVMIISPAFLKGGSDAEQVLWLAAAGLSILGSLTYFVGRYTFWSRYPRQELRFAFTPMILSAVIFVGLVLAITVAAVLAK